MALHMISVSSVPDAPTSIPADDQHVVVEDEAGAAAARPVNELRSEITTGMSAPPIGMHQQHAQGQRAEEEHRNAGLLRSGSTIAIRAQDEGTSSPFDDLLAADRRSGAPVKILELPVGDMLPAKETRRSGRRAGC